MNSALQQALQGVQTAGNRLAVQMSGGGKNLIQGALKEARRMMNKVGNKIHKSPVPQNRVGRGSGTGQTARPVGHLMNGQTLYADGTVKPTQDDTFLNNVRNSVLDQFAFTPKAEEYLRTLPLGYTTQENASGLFSNYGMGFAPGQEAIALNTLLDYDVTPQNRRRPTYAPAKTMAHEMLHALDKNLSYINSGHKLPNTLRPTYDIKQLPGKLGDSRHFNEILSQANNKDVTRSLQRFFAGYDKDYFRGRPDRYDTEAFAQYGAERGQNALLGPAPSAYGQVFSPMSKQPNQSYKYPVRANMTSKIKNKVIKNLAKKQLGNMLPDEDDEELFR